MKKNNFFRWMVLSCLALLVGNVSAQTIVNHPGPGSVGNLTFTIAPPGTCSFSYFDNGGSTAAYSSSINNLTVAQIQGSTVTFAPSNPATHRIQAIFTSFATENSFDALYIWDGPNAGVMDIPTLGTPAAPQISSGLGALNTPLAGGFQGATAPGTRTASGASGALTFSFSSDTSVTSAGWAATIVQVPINPCTMTAPAALGNFGTNPATACSATVSVATPTFAPVGCNTAYNLQYRINGGAAVVVASQVAAPPTVAIALPLGAFSLTWELVDPCGNAVVSSATSTGAVADDDAPSITCAPNVTLDLAPGACNIAHTYTIAAQDNCPFAGPLTTLSTVTTPGPTNNGGSVSGMTYFNVTNTSTDPIQISGFQMNVSALSTVNVWTRPGTQVGFAASMAGWTLATTGTMPATGPFSGGFPGNGTLTPVTLAAPISIAPGATIGIGLHTPTASQNYNNGGAAAPGNIFTNGVVSIGAGQASNTAFGATFTPRVFNGSVIYQVFLPVIPVTQTAGLPSGSEFPIGTTTNCFTATDAAGLTATCCFNVTVREYPNATNTLTCNDLVNISLDATCTTTVGADQILEGGPYRCYDRYIVEVDKVGPNLTNGPWVPAVLGSADINKTYGVRVTDPTTGNMCWGNIFIEDKLAPTITNCDDFSVACGESIAPIFTPIQRTAIGKGNNLPILGEGTNTPFIATAPFNAPPSTINDVNVLVNIDVVSAGSWLGDLSVILTSPSGTQVPLWTQGACNGNFDLITTFDDEAATCTNACADYGTGATLQTINCLGLTASNLSAFDGQNPSGTWTLRVVDNFNDAGVDFQINDFQVIINYTAPFGNAPRGLDNCGTPTMTFIDVRTPGSCALGYAEQIQRKWTATDAGGLTATCIQTISVTLPTLGDVVAPPNYDNIDQDALDCATAPRNAAGQLDPALLTPAYLNSIGLVGFPTINGAPIGCTLGATYSDDVVSVCDGTYKIRREWHVIDWCTGGDLELVQIIKVIDDSAPTFTCPSDMTVSTDANQCCATVNLPDVIVNDDCSRFTTSANNINAMVIGIDPLTGDTIGMFPVGGSFANFPGNNLWNPDTLAAFGTTPCLPVGKHSVIYSITDNCGNVATCEFELTVLDLTPPVAVCIEKTVVGIGWDDTQDCYLPDTATCKFAGVSWVKASSFDNGSYDNCGNVYFTVRRMPIDTALFPSNPNPLNPNPVPTLSPVFTPFIMGLNGANSNGNCLRFADPSGNNLCNFASANEQTQSPAPYPLPQPSEFAIATNYYGNGAWLTCDVQSPSFPVMNYAFTPLFTGKLGRAVNYNCIEIPTPYTYPGTQGAPASPNLTAQPTILGQDSIKFYCDEVGTTQTVILRVYQLDDQGRIQLNAIGEPIFNECMIDVTIQDKLKPVCQSPANVTVTCENFDPSLWAYGTPTVFDNCCLDVTKVYNGQKGIEHSVNYAQFDTLCNRGTIVRTFRAYDCAGLSSQCTQRVVVNYNQDYFFHLPSDRIVNDCEPTGNYGEPIIFDEDCELVGTSYTDELITVVPDACFKIVRTWRISNWCTYNPDLPCIAIPNPNPSPIANNVANLNGPVLKVTPFASNNTSVPVDFRSTLIAITPGAQQTDYSTFWSATANCYEYNQIIKVIDNNKPVIDNCPTAPVQFGDVTDNNPLLYSNPFFNDPVHNIHDLCEMDVDLSIVTSDLCAGTDVNVRYLLFLDTDNSGDMETVINSANAPDYGFINVGNAGNANYAGGQPLQFDLGYLQGGLRRFALQQTVAGGKRTARVAFNTLAAPNAYVLPQLPHGTHKIKWLVQDGCGNEATCEYTFTIRDTKAPTVVCLNGISVNIMPTGMIDIWDTELLQYTTDNCTPDAQLETAICKTCTSFPLDANGNPVKSVRFTCSELGTQEVRIWSRDKANPRNADYCKTYVLVQDNAGNCQTGNKSVAGDLKGMDKNNVAQGLQDATVQVTGSSPFIPNINLNAISNVGGHFQLNSAVPVSSNFTITPVKDGNYLNGVDMLDVLKIQRHILGLEPLASPYRMIAADVNNTGSITSSDIVELRKLILGAYTVLPNVASYRFVDKSYTFPNANNPFVPGFPEIISVAQLQGDYMNGNFEVAKMGDVTGNSQLNNLMSADDRTAGTLLFDAADRKVVKGEEFTVEFTAAERVLGYQFTMNAKGLNIVDVVPGAGMDMNNFAVFANKGAMTTVVEEAAAKASFSVKFRATESGDLSKMLSVSSEITKAVAYTNETERYDVGFRFNGQGGSVISGVGFELYQNQPNPFINNTVIGFHLPEAAAATLTVYDELGRTLFTQKGDFAKGYNSINIERNKLNATGVLFYTVETATASATKQMIQTK